MRERERERILWRDNWYGSGKNEEKVDEYVQTMKSVCLAFDYEQRVIQNEENFETTTNKTRQKIFVPNYAFSAMNYGRKSYNSYTSVLIWFTSNVCLKNK